MLLSLNEVSLTGYVGQEPKLFTDKFDKRTVRFSLCTTESWKDKNGDYVQKSEWHRICVKTDGLVDLVMNRVHKGTPLFVRGKLETYKKNKDEDVTLTDIVLSRMDSKIIILESKEKEPGAKEQVTRSRDELDDEVPF